MVRPRAVMCRRWHPITFLIGLDIIIDLQLMRAETVL